MAPVGAALVPTRVRHSVLFAVSLVASIMLSLVSLFKIISPRPLPRLPSTKHFSRRLYYVLLFMTYIIVVYVVVYVVVLVFRIALRDFGNLRSINVVNT